MKIGSESVNYKHSSLHCNVNIVSGNVFQLRKQVCKRREQMSGYELDSLSHLNLGLLKIS